MERGSNGGNEQRKKRGREIEQAVARLFKSHPLPSPSFSATSLPVCVFVFLAHRALEIAGTWRVWMLVFLRTLSVVIYISVPICKHTHILLVCVGGLDYCVFWCNSRDGLQIISSIEDFLSSLLLTHTSALPLSFLPLSIFYRRLLHFHLDYSEVHSTHLFWRHFSVSALGWQEKQFF